MSSTSKYQAYPSYKDSGVEWLGQIPEGWELSKLRFLFSFGTGLGITKSNLKDSGIPCVNYGEIHSKYGFEVTPEKHPLKCVGEEYLQTSPNALLSKGDFVFADTSEDIEGSGNFTQLISDTSIFAGYHTVVARQIKENNSRFLAYLFDSQPFRTQIRHAVKGVKVFSITQAILKNATLWMPTIKEQKTIAHFLDQEAGKMDLLIEKQQALIELTIEKIKSIVLTESFNSTNDVIRLKHLVNVIKRPVILKLNQEYTAIGLYNRGRGLFHKKPKEKNDMGDSDFFWVKEGDLIISGQFAWEGSVAIASELETGCVVSHRYPILRGKANVLETEYLLALLMTSFGDFLLNESSRGAAGRNRPLNISLLLKEKITVPSQDVQKEVTRLLVLKNVLQIKVNQNIQLLKERKTALISAAVTGKIDVRGL